MKAEPARPAKLVVFGLGGDSVYLGSRKTTYGSSTSTITGYGSPDKPHAADFSKDDRYAPDGTYAIDITADGCDVMWSVRGPMVDVDLDDGAVDPCPTATEPVASALDIGFGGLLTRHKAHKARSSAPGPLDKVSIAEHVASWREHGARIGRYLNGSIRWET